MPVFLKKKKQGKDYWIVKRVFGWSLGIVSDRKRLFYK